MPAPSLYHVTIPVLLQVEASNAAEAQAEFMELWRTIAARLPTGASTSISLGARREHLQHDTMRG